MGPSPIEKNPTKANTAAIAKATAQISFWSELLMTVIEMASNTSEAIIPPTLVRSKGRRPILSSKNVATRMNAVLLNPTATVASSLSVSLVIPVQKINRKIYQYIF